MDRPKISKNVIAEAKTDYEQKLATYVIRQEEYINQLEGGEPKRTVPFITPQCNRVEFRDCEHWMNTSVGCYKCEKAFKKA